MEETVSIYPLATLRKGYARRLYEAQQEAARVWTVCRDRHLAARTAHTRWPTRNDLQQATKGQFALHSQTVQMVCHQFLANVDTARELRQTNRKIRYPYKDKRFFPLYWPAQAVSVQRGRIVLPMGRGRPSLVFKLDLPERIGGCTLVWKDGYELHVSVPISPAATAPGEAQATVDLGEIHQTAVTTNNGIALVVSGRGIRSLKRRHHMALGQLAKKRKRCTPGSRRSRKLEAARRRLSARKRRQIRDLRHKGIRKVIAFCQQHGVGRLFIGNPDGCASTTVDATIPSGWQAGNTDKTSRISRTKPKQPASRASLVQSGEPRASVRYAAGNSKSKDGAGAAVIQSVPLRATGTWSAVSTCTRWPLGPRSPSPLTSRINELAPYGSWRGVNSRVRCTAVRPL